MSIKMQKKLRFIPIINIVTMFFWIRICSRKSIGTMDFIKELLKIFLGFIIITAFRIAISFILKNETLDKIVMYISIYFYFLVMSLGAVEAQEKILLNEQK